MSVGSAGIVGTISVVDNAGTGVGGGVMIFGTMFCFLMPPAVGVH